MPQRTCAAIGCPNNSYKNSEINFFKPKNVEIQQKWLQACPNGTKNMKNVFICSEHFRQKEIKNSGKRVCLRDKNTLPTVWRNLM